MATRRARAAATLAGAGLLMLACQPAPPATPAPSTVLVRGDVTRVPAGTPAGLANFALDVPAPPSDSGECTRRWLPGGGGQTISVSYPSSANAVASAVAIVDTSGRLVRFSDRRGRARIKGVPGGTRAQQDSAFAEARRTIRSSTVSLDYVLGQAMLMNDGGGKEDEALMVPLRAVANDPRFGSPDARAHAVLARCATTPLSDARGMNVDLRGAPEPLLRRPSTARCPGNPLFEFQVEKPASYHGVASISPHPADTGPVVAQFVVDTAGRPVVASFRILRSSDSTLVADAARMLTRWSYLPAEIGGCKVPQMVQTAIAR